jgi:hypothetical protein
MDLCGNCGGKGASMDKASVTWFGWVLIATAVGLLSVALHRVRSRDSDSN